MIFRHDRFIRTLSFYHMKDICTVVWESTTGITSKFIRKHWLARIKA